MVRDKNYSKAVLSSLVARFSGVVLQVISMPIAAVALGAQGFTIYSMITATLSWLTLSNFGLGPALTVRFSSEYGTGEAEAPQQSFSTASLITFTITLSVGFIALVAIFATPLPMTLFHQFQNQAQEVVLSLALAVGVFALAQNLSIVEATQLGLQESYRLNRFTATGTLVAAGAVFLAAALAPRPAIILLAVQGPVLIARLFNAFDVLHRHPALRIRPRQFDRRLGGNLLANGLKFSMAGSVSNFLSHVAPIMIVGTVCPPTYAAVFAAVINAVIILASVFGMTVAPLLGMVPEARAREDWDWIRRAYRRVMTLNFVYSIVVMAIFAGAGSTIFGLWYQNSLNFPPILVTLAGVYLVTLSVDVTNHAFLSGLNRIGTTAFFSVLKAGVSALLLLILADPAMTALPLQLMIAASALLSIIPMSVLLHSTIKSKLATQ
jgi:O-antigen/teichoic acid export membrane protein